MENVINFDLLKEYDGALKEVLKVWRKQKSYSIDDIIQYKGNYLKCITAGTSGTITLNFTGLDVGDTITDGTVIWEIIEPPSGGGVDLPEWQANTSYTTGKYLVHEGTVYKVDNDFTSGNTFSDANLTAYIAPIMEGATSSTDGKAGMVIKPTTTDIDKFLKGDGTWGSAGGGISIWQANTAYNVNDVVIDSNLIWQCATAHTSTTTFDESKWVCISGGEVSNGMEIVPLWEGSFSFNNSVEGTTPTSSTPMIELVDSLTKFDYVYITVRCGSESNSCVVPQGIIVGGEAIRVGVFASKDYYTTANINCYDSSHLYINYTFTYQWPVGEITSVQGIRKAKPIVSSGMKYEILWEGEAGDYNNSFNITIPTSEPITKYKKLGLNICISNSNANYYRELDVKIIMDIINSSSGVYTMNNGYGDTNDYIDILSSSSISQLVINGNKSKVTKITGISEGLQIPTGVQAARVTLWEGTKTGDDSINVPLLDNISNYDVLEIESCIAWNADGTSKNGYISSLFEVGTILENPTAYISVSNFLNSSYNYAMDVTFPDNTYFKIQDFSKGASLVTADITKIVGIKYIQPDSYSTEEKLIGTWIDGKPLYRKVFENPTNGMNTGMTSSNFTFINLWGWRVGGANRVPNKYSDISINISTGVINIEGATNVTYAVLEYTKN